jgi:NADH-quinone oxidoreductase subunit J
MSATSVGAGNVFFAVCALVALVGALMTITAKNPIRCAVGLLATILGIAGLFLQLNAQFLAAIQLIVYAGAVVVLFVFVIMLLGSDATGTERGPGRVRLSRVVAGLLTLVLAAVVLVMLAKVDSGPVRFAPARADHGTTEAVGTLLFTRALVPFELATALLIVAVIGAIAVARSYPAKKKQKQVASPTERMFHGPLHPRDAGRPLGRERLG